MSGPSDLWLAVVIGAGATLAVVRLALWRRGAVRGETGPPWRLPALIALNLTAGTLLYLALDPPDVGLRSGQLVVRTAGAPTAVEARTDDVIVSLPEAPFGAGERVPDLATALRRHPEVRSLHVVGVGLSARDRAVVDRPLDFDPPTPLTGFTRLELPTSVTPGAPFAVSGSIGAVDRATVEFVDPSGVVVDRLEVSSGSRFVVSGAARAAGLAVFDLRLKNARGQLLERVDVPLEAREPQPPRVVVMAGAPGPETRFLRRWAESVGIDLSVQLALGAGVDLTAQPAPVTVARLSETDLLVIDERRWETLGSAERAAVRAAVVGGMGLLLRPTGPLSETVRRDWASLGAALTGGETLRPLALEAASEPEPRTSSSEDTAPTLPELSRRDFSQGGANAAVLLGDADGIPLASWRPYGSGRVGVWVVADSYALVLTGQSNRYGALWSRMFSVLARADGEPAPRFHGMARVGERAILCGVSAGQTLVGPDGKISGLIVDPRAGPSHCAAIWAERPGWHSVVDAGTEIGVVYVHPNGTTPSLVATETREAIMEIGSSARPVLSASRPKVDGSPWPWLLALLAALAALWWLERKRPLTLSQSGDPRLS